MGKKSENSPRIYVFLQDRTCSVDVKISALSMLTGLRMEQTVEFMKQMNVATGSRATFYRIQKDYVNPIIWLTWIEMKEELYDEMRGKELRVMGDGQFDSPGYSASYCFYTVVESTTDKVKMCTQKFSSIIRKSISELSQICYLKYSKYR
jgi:hypothetical protein